jgi:hypothetical protein
VTAAVYWFICAREAYPSALPTAAANQASFNRQATNAIAGLRKSRHGIGDLLARPNGNAVPNHLLCDGSAIDRISYPQLFAEIGTEWGAGDGSTTFNLPSLNGGTLPTPTTLPPQTVDTGGTVSTGGTVIQPSDPGQTGGTSGGNVTTGGRPKKINGQLNPDTEPAS